MRRADLSSFLLKSDTAIDTNWSPVFQRCKHDVNYAAAIAAWWWWWLACLTSKAWLRLSFDGGCPPFAFVGFRLSSGLRNGC